MGLKFCISMFDWEVGEFFLVGAVEVFEHRYLSNKNLYKKVEIIMVWRIKNKIYHKNKKMISKCLKRFESK